MFTSLSHISFSYLNYTALLGKVKEIYGIFTQHLPPLTEIQQEGGGERYGYTMIGQQKTTASMGVYGFFIGIAQVSQFRYVRSV